MIEWELIAAGIRAVDGTKSELLIGTTGFERRQTDHDIDHPVDETVTGVVEQLHLPPSYSTLTDSDTGETVELGSRTGPLELDPGGYLLNVSASIKTYVRFDGPARVSIPADYERLSLEFPEKRPVTIGFRSRFSVPEATVTVPETVAGLATAIGHAASAHRTTGPERSYPTLRKHPPLVAFGETTEIPDAVSESTPDTGIEIQIPERLESLFVVSPLAYYLGASVSVEPGCSPRIRAPSVGVDRALDDPSLVETVPSLLARTFWLDCLVRNEGPHGSHLTESELLDRLSFDPAAAYRATPAERLRTYLEASYERVADDLPDWHLAMHVEPTTSHGTALPYLLDRLAFIYPPETTPLAGKELMERSLDDFYRSPRPTASVDRQKPKLRRGRIQGWLAEGTPIDVFKSLPEAYENRFSYLGQGEDALAVTVVLNESEMQAEQSEVADIYRTRSAALPIDVTMRYDLTRAELADVFAAENDFVHYIGHCEETGLRCADGTLAVADIEESNTQTFFLNACGSYYEGLDLVRKGSVAGAVTFQQVLNEQAAKVGTAFARLLVNGYSIERAIQLARRRIMMGKDYAVVGDGTYVLTQSQNFVPLSCEIAADGDTFHLRFESLLADSTGGIYQVFLPEIDRSSLVGNDLELVLTRSELADFLDRAEMAIVYEGRFYWSDELAEQFD